MAKPAYQNLALSARAARILTQEALLAHVCTRRSILWAYNSRYKCTTTEIFFRIYDGAKSVHVPRVGIQAGRPFGMQRISSKEPIHGEAELG